MIKQRVKSKSSGYQMHFLKYVDQKQVHYLVGFKCECIINIWLYITQHNDLDLKKNTRYITEWFV